MAEKVNNGSNTEKINNKSNDYSCRSNADYGVDKLQVVCEGCGRMVEPDTRGYCTECIQWRRGLGPYPIDWSLPGKHGWGPQKASNGVDKNEKGLGDRVSVRYRCRHRLLERKDVTDISSKTTSFTFLR